MIIKEELISFEDEICVEFNKGNIKSPVHLYSNNEEQMIEIFKDIKEEDWVLYSWRSHYQCLLKGVDRDILKKDIISGRSIALSYPSHKIYSSAIVTGNIPISVGIALDEKLKNSKNHIWCFVGDMTSETGTFYENYKYAVNFDLPITFVIENNFKSVCTDTLNVWNQKKNTYSDKKMDKIIYYEYNNKYPHAGTGIRIQF